MLIGYSMPAVTSVALTSTKTGAAFLGTTSDGLADGLPARVARLQWMTAAGQVIGDYVRLSLLLSESKAHRCACVLGLTLPVNTQIRAELYDAHSGGALVGGITTRTVVLPDGTVGAWFVWASSIGASNRLDVLLYNDVGGSAAIAAGTVFEVGEIAVMPAIEVQHQSEWADDAEDPTESFRTRDAQPATVARVAYRRLEVTLSVDGAAAAFGGGLANGMDMARLRRALRADARTMAVPRWRDDGLSIDLARVNQTALYGTARFGGIAHQGGDYFAASITFTEAPAN